MLQIRQLPLTSDRVHQVAMYIILHIYLIMPSVEIGHELSEARGLPGRDESGAKGFKLCQLPYTTLAFFVLAFSGL